MNYLWEVALRADDNGVKREALNYVPAAVCSPYAEASFTDLNQSGIEDRRIEVNPLYRFADIFAAVFDINMTQSPKLRRKLFHITMQYFIQTDLRQGLSKREYYLRFILRDILRGAYGDEMARAIKYFTHASLRQVLICLLSRCKCGASIALFRQAMRAVYPDAIIYSNNDVYRELLIYIGMKETPEEKSKIDFLTDAFLPINYTTHLFWEHHFGIIDVDVTMTLDEMVLY